MRARERKLMNEISKRAFGKTSKWKILYKNGIAEMQNNELHKRIIWYNLKDLRKYMRGIIDKKKQLLDEMKAKSAQVSQIPTTDKPS